MQVKQEINVYKFRDMFRNAGRSDNFSYEGLGILFDYLESYQEDIDEPLELDVIALCCDFNEMSWRDVANDYSVDLSHCGADGDCDNDDERTDAVREYLEDNTSLCGEFEDTNNGTTFVFQVF